jgi:hypothetical protein
VLPYSCPHVVQSQFGDQTHLLAREPYLQVGAACYSCYRALRRQAQLPWHGGARSRCRHPPARLGSGSQLACRAAPPTADGQGCMALNATLVINQLNALLGSTANPMPWLRAAAAAVAAARLPEVGAAPLRPELPGTRCSAWMPQSTTHESSSPPT